MRRLRRWLTLLGGAFVSAGLAATIASAQGLSDRPIFLVVPFTPGTGPDVLARTLGEELRQRWKQPVVVDNKPGASGNIGTQAAASAAPDGHTLLMTVNTFVMNAGLFKSLPYDPQKSFAPIAEIATGAVALVVHPSLGVASAREFIDHAKARPGELNYASPGRGTPQHLAMELFKLTARIDVKHVPYTGSAGAVKDLLGGHVKAMFLPVHTALPLVQDKQIRKVDLWYGILAPAATPREILERYNRVVNEIVAAPHVREALEKQGLTPRGGAPERLADLIAKDQPRWAKVVKDAGITAE